MTYWYAFNFPVFSSLPFRFWYAEESTSAAFTNWIVEVSIYLESFKQLRCLSLEKEVLSEKFLYCIIFYRDV